jgi:hypothetical protein
MGFPLERASASSAINQLQSNFSPKQTGKVFVEVLSACVNTIARLQNLPQCLMKQTVIKAKQFSGLE